MEPYPVSVAGEKTHLVTHVDHPITGMRIKWCEDGAVRIQFDVPVVITGAFLHDGTIQVQTR